MAQPLKPIECSAQPLSISFHPFRDLVAAGLVDGTVEVHELLATPKSKTGGDDTMDDSSDEEDDDDEKLKTASEDEADTILSSIYVAKTPPESKLNTNVLTKIVDGKKDDKGATLGKATQGPSCRCVLFSTTSANEVKNSNAENDKDASKESIPRTGGEYLFTACNGGSIRCLDSKLACSIDASGEEHEVHPSILWSVENAHSVGINKLFQLPHSSPCGPLLVTGDDAGTIRLWDTKLLCAEQDQKQSSSGSNPFDNLMKLPWGCVMSWKVNQDYITDFEVSNDGKILFATSADGTLSVFDLKFVNKKGTTRSVVLPDIDPQQQQQSNKKPTWETHGYTKSDNQEDELLSVVLIKNSQKLLVGSHQGILSIFSYNLWGDITDRFPGHPQSIDALLKIDEDTVLTGSSDGLVRAVQLMPNNFLGVLGAHDGFPVEGLAWSAGRKMLGSVSHDEYIRLWDGSFLNDDDDDDDDEDIGKSCETDGKGMSLEGTSSGKQGVGVATKADRNNSDDEWEDMDEDDEDMDDDSDSDDSDDGAGNKSRKREKIFKTANEEFFSDL